MKKIVEMDEAEGLEALLGEEVLIWCECYIYHGTLVGVNEKDIKLENAGVVYETGPFDAKQFKDCQRFKQKHWYIRIDKIESYGAWN